MRAKNKPEEEKNPRALSDEENVAKLLADEGLTKLGLAWKASLLILWGRLSTIYVIPYWKRLCRRLLAPPVNEAEGEVSGPQCPGVWRGSRGVDDVLSLTSGLITSVYTGYKEQKSQNARLGVWPLTPGVVYSGRNILRVIHLVTGHSWTVWPVWGLPVGSREQTVSSLHIVSFSLHCCWSCVELQVQECTEYHIIVTSKMTEICKSTLYIQVYGRKQWILLYGYK